MVFGSLVSFSFFFSGLIQVVSVCIIFFVITYYTISFHFMLLLEGCCCVFCHLNLFRKNFLFARSFFWTCMHVLYACLAYFFIFIAREVTWELKWNWNVKIKAASNTTTNTNAHFPKWKHKWHENAKLTSSMGPIHVSGYIACQMVNRTFH